MESPDALTAASLKPLGSDASTVVGEGLRAYVERRAAGGSDRATAAREAFAVVERLAAAGGFDEDFRRTTLAKISDAAPFEAWEAWLAVRSADESTEVLRAIAWDMAAIDPGKAMETMLRDAAGAGTSDIYRQWSAKSPTEAAEWFAKNSQLVPEKERDWRGYDSLGGEGSRCRTILVPTALGDSPAR